MRITIENTDQIVQIEPRSGGKIPARVWKGVTDSGIECQVLVTRIAVHKQADNSAFERELTEPPTATLEGRAYDLRLFID